MVLVPLIQDSALTPGSCRAQSPGSWCRPPPTAGWTRRESAARAPCASAPPGTEPETTEARGCLKTCHYLIYRVTCYICQGSKWDPLTDKFLKDAMHFRMSGRSGWLSWRNKNKHVSCRPHTDTQVLCGRCFYTHLHVPLKLFEQVGVFVESHEGFAKACGQGENPGRDGTSPLHKLPQHLTARGRKDRGSKKKIESTFQPLWPWLTLSAWVCNKHAVENVRHLIKANIRCWLPSNVLQRTHFLDRWIRVQHCSPNVAKTSTESEYVWKMGKLFWRRITNQMKSFTMIMTLRMQCIEIRCETSSGLFLNGL